MLSCGGGLLTAAALYMEVVCVEFMKMHGLGNDYIYLNCLEGLPEGMPALARRMSRRHFGVGADGVICLCPSERADFGMRIFNADGSEGEMCGNGIRCLGKYVYELGLTDKTSLSIETPAGVKFLAMTPREGRVEEVTVDMGVPELDRLRILTVGGGRYTVRPVSMGNPHAVIVLPEVGGLDLEALGPCFERHPSFPGRVNTEFVEVLDRDRLRMRVWERGSGETMACGTGACAALAAAADAGLTGRSAAVLLPGGELRIRWADNQHIYMTGPAVTVFKGEYEDGTD